MSGFCSITPTTIPVVSRRPAGGLLRPAAHVLDAITYSRTVLISN
jgi:hypothetical protein